jgi:uncharacterized membrane protein
VLFFYLTLYTEGVFGLYVSLTLLGLAAIDPIGIGVLPILLVQKQPYMRASVFLSGSFVSLMAMGLVFAKGLGQLVLQFEQHNHWFVPTVEIIGGTALLTVAFIQVRAGKTTIQPTGRARKWLKLGNWHLFLLGFLLVAVQSIVDVVFLVAMVRIGQLSLSNIELVSAVTIYSVAALVFQIAVIGVFRFSPPRQKEKTLQRVHTLLLKYANQALILVSLALGCLLFALAA